MVRARRYALFATAIGECAVAWNAIGLTHIWLPAAPGAMLERAVRGRCPGAQASTPAGEVGAVVAAIVRLLAGEHVRFDDDVPLDLTGIDPFDARVYAAARTIAPGHVLTYGEVAARLGGDASARAVGQSLGRNRWPIVVPCHRVVAAGHALGGFSAPGGMATKSRLLAIERARRNGERDLFDAVACDASACAAEATQPVDARSQLASPAVGTATTAPSSAAVRIEPSGRT